MNRTRPPSGEVLPGFESISRTWDSRHETWAARILPGEYYVTRHNEMITTVLGSCVSACFRDPVTGVGGMNHFMLPGEERAASDGEQERLATRYGLAAMENLVNDILKTGARKDRLELKLFGGGKVLAMEINNVGGRNIEFVKEFARVEGFRISAEDLGSEHPRKVNYFPRTGRVLVRRLASVQQQEVAARERSYQATICKRKEAPGAIELFD